MRLPPTIPATFLRRDNRYRLTVAVDGEEVAAHLSDPGRLEELLVPGRTLYLAPAGALSRAPSAGRKTAYDAVLADYDGVLVSVMPRLANTLLEEALRAGWRPGSAGEHAYPDLRREAPLGASRIDFLLSGPTGRLWVEAKSCSLVEGGLALFPDAPTARGARHLGELVDAVAAGDGAAVVFVIQRGDARRLAPHRARDPRFAERLAAARRAGVGVHALGCAVSRGEIRIVGGVPVEV